MYEISKYAMSVVGRRLDEVKAIAGARLTEDVEGECCRRW